MAFSVSSDITNTEPDYSAHIFEMQEIRTVLVAMTTSPVQGLYNGMPVPPHTSPPATLLSCAPPRRYYCWLHEWNNTHNEVFVGKIMRTNQAYTVHTVHSRDEKRGAYRCRHGRQPQNWGTGITPRPPNCFNPFTYFIFSPPVDKSTPTHHVG